MLAEIAAQASRIRRAPIEPQASRSLLTAVLALLSRHITRNTAATSMIESRPKSIRLICRSLAANVSERAPSSVQWMAPMISIAHAQRSQRFSKGCATPAQEVEIGRVHVLVLWYILIDPREGWIAKRNRTNLRSEQLTRDFK